MLAAKKPSPGARPSLRLSIELGRISWNWMLVNDATQSKIDTQPTRILWGLKLQETLKLGSWGL